MQDVVNMIRSPSAVGRFSSRRGRRRAITFYLFVSPWLLGFVILWLVPLVIGLGLSFSNFNGLNYDSLRFVGFRHYLLAFQKEDFWISFRNTFSYMLVTVPIWNALGLCLALLLNRPIRGRTFFRTLYYIPTLLPLVAAVKAWRLMFNQNSGIVNALLSFIWPGTAINWLNDYFQIVLYLFSFWGAGGAMVVYLAGLQGIPRELLEAARIDGANHVQVFRWIILPLLTPVLFFQAVLGMIFSLQVLAQPVLLYPRVSATANTVSLPHNLYMYMVYVYSQTFDFQRYGYGIAMSWIIFLVILVLTSIVVSTSRFWVYYEVAQEEEKP